MGGVWYVTGVCSSINQMVSPWACPVVEWCINAGNTW